MFTSLAVIYAVFSTLGEGASKSWADLKSKGSSESWRSIERRKQEEWRRLKSLGVSEECVKPRLNMESGTPAAYIEHVGKSVHEGYLQWASNAEDCADQCYKKMIQAPDATHSDVCNFWEYRTSSQMCGLLHRIRGHNGSEMGIKLLPRDGIIIGLPCLARADDYKLISPWRKGYAAAEWGKCRFRECVTYSGNAQGLRSCKYTCDDDIKCNTFSFIPNGADGSSGPGRCCTRDCDVVPSVMNGMLTRKWQGWDVYTKTDDYELISPWRKGYAAAEWGKCRFLTCKTYSGNAQGLRKCKHLCDDNRFCNTFSFIPYGADGSSGPGRCCPRDCDVVPSVRNGMLTRKWQGWDVYTKLKNSDWDFRRLGQERGRNSSSPL